MQFVADRLEAPTAIRTRSSHIFHLIVRINGPHSIDCPMRSFRSDKGTVHEQIAELDRHVETFPASR